MDWFLDGWIWSDEVTATEFEIEGLDCFDGATWTVGLDA